MKVKDLPKKLMQSSIIVYIIKVFAFWISLENQMKGFKPRLPSGKISVNAILHTFIGGKAFSPLDSINTY